jgi:hypothetical protein
MADKMTLAEAEGLLTDDEITKLREKARKDVLAERKKLAEDAMLKELRAQERRELGVVTGDERRDEMVFIMVDLAEYANHILIDGKAYFHGHDYPVQRHVAETLREIMQRSHQHQAQVDGKDPLLSYRRHKTDIISGRSGAVTRVVN